MSARTCSAVVAGALALLAGGASAAQADPYIVDHCAVWDTGAPAASLAGTTSSTNASITDDCDVGGTAGGLKAQLPTARLVSGQSVFIRLEIPADRPNLHIDRVKTGYGALESTTPSAFLQFSAGGKLLDTYPDGTAHADDRTLQAGTRKLLWNVVCGGGPCVFPGQYVLVVGTNQLYLNESVAPEIAVTGGSLVDGSDQRGQASLAFTAEDQDSGVAGMAVRLGDVTVGGTSWPCVSKDWSPCERSRTNQAITIDTTQVPDGSHPLTVLAWDTARNVSTIAQGTVNVANGTPAGEPALPPGPNGSGASRKAKLTVGWGGTRSRTRTMGYTASPTIRGKLADENGTPITGAALFVSSRLRKASAPRARIATVTTGADGSFTYKLASGPARTLTVDYLAFGEDPQPSASRVLTARVRASLTGSPSQRTVRAGRVLRFSGRLRHLPRSGIRVDIQAYELGKWKAASVNVKTTADGRFRWSHRFGAAAAGHKFLFRARVDSPIYPFAPGTSRPVGVIVR